MESNVINEIINKLIKKFQPDLLSEEADVYTSKLEKLYLDNHTNVPEPLIIKYYQLNDEGESYPLSYHQYNFVKNLEIILKNQSQLSLEEVTDCMKKIIDSDIDDCPKVFEIIFESRPDISVDDVISFVKEIMYINQSSDTQISTKISSFLGSEIFKTILELNQDSSLEQVKTQFIKIVDPYFLNVSSQENGRALVDICELCKNGNVEEMQRFDFSNYDLDTDSAGVLQSLLQQCELHYKLEQSELYYNGLSDDNLNGTAYPCQDSIL